MTALRSASPRFTAKGAAALADWTDGGEALPSAVCPNCLIDLAELYCDGCGRTFAPITHRAQVFRNWKETVDGAVASYAYCPVCEWIGDSHGTVSAAQEDADAHNKSGPPAPSQGMRGRALTKGV